MAHDRRTSATCWCWPPDNWCGLRLSSS
jgi:hypothetical protein